jgi:hypothetical protein
VILSAEDGTADTIVPRLIAAGADLSRIVQLKGIRLDDYERPPVFPSDLPALAEAVRAVEAAWVIVDPLVAYFGDETDTWKDQSIRRALYFLERFCEETGVGILGMRHFTKTASLNPLHLGGGSIGLIGAARVALLVAPDPDNTERRVLAESKNNLSRKPSSLMYELEDCGEVARVKWLGDSPHSAQTLVAVPSNSEERGELDDATDFLRAALADGPRTVREVGADARAAGISQRTLERARRALKVNAERVGGVAGRGAWVLVLGGKAASGGLSENARIQATPPKTANGGLSSEDGGLNLTSADPDRPYRVPFPGEDV